MKLLLFSKKHFLQSRMNDGKLVSAVNSVESGWPDVAEGLTEIEAERKHVFIVEKWCVDVPDNFMELLQDEIVRQIDETDDIGRKSLSHHIDAFVTSLADIVNVPLSRGNKDALVMFTMNLINGGNENC